MSIENHGGMMMFTEENPLLIHQSSLAILQPDTPGSKQEECEKGMRI
jgi:hypothetical protein